MLAALSLLACSVSMDSGPRDPDSGVRYDVDGDGWFHDEECDDNNPHAFPGGTEVCDGEDNDCNGLVDDDAKDGQLIYADVDHDGYAADDAKGTIGCEKTTGLTTKLGDCDDANATVSPDAKEVCGDGVDNDCEGGDADC